MAKPVAQVDELAGILAEQGRALDHVVELTVDVDEVVGRLLKRSAEQGRSDDTEDVVRRRLQVYFEQTAPLIDAYAAQGLLVKVEGTGSVDEVTARVLAALGV